MSEVVDAMLCTLFDSEVTKSIFEMTGIKEGKIYTGTEMGTISVYIVQLIRTRIF